MSVPTERTNLGPLTTTFSAPSSCSVLDGSFTKTGGGLNGAVGYACRAASGNGQIFGPDPACFPNSLASYINTGDKWLTSMAVYSPGSICPNGFSSACTMTRSANDEPPTTGRLFQTASRAMFNILEIGETAVGCCPAGYTCASDDVYKCYTPGSVSQVLTGIIRETSCTPQPTTFTIQSLSDTTSIAYGRRLLMIQGSPNGETDNPTSASKGQSPSSTRSTPTSSRRDGSSTSYTENTSSPPSSHNNAGSGGGGGLTTSAKIAIGVTIPAIAVLLVLAIFMLCFIRRKRRAKAESEKSAVVTSDRPGPLPPPPGRQELAGTAGYAYQQPGQEPYFKPELLGQPLSEAPGQTVYDKTSELQGSNQQLAWNQGATQQQIPAPNYTELATNRPDTAIVSSTVQLNNAPASSLPTQADTRSSAQAANEPWKWNQPLYPDSH